jgi:RHS repeat-associated protein
MSQKQIRNIALVMLLAVVAVSGQQQDRAARTPTASPGQTTTLMPDGRSLILGGEGSESRVLVWDPVRRTTVPGGALNHPRAWHTTTLLPDGTLLVFGGVDADGETVAAPEQFDPAIDAFRVLPTEELAPRAHHAATLLIDGQVLITGGQSQTDVTLDDAVLWNSTLRTATAVPAFLRQPRRDHTSTLRADGSISLAGGRGADGRPLVRDEAYDPVPQLFTDVARSANVAQSSAVADSLPANGAIAVSTGTRVAIRFSEPIDVSTLRNDRVMLVGPEGAVPAQIVSAEGGRLLFINPNAPLREDSSYEVHVRGLRDSRRGLVPETVIGFGTGGAPSSGDALADDETWLPIHASRWRTDRDASSWETQPRLEAAPGVTALSGQVLKLNSTPLAGVTLRIGQRSTRSDRTGRFLLTNVPAGHQVLEIEGASASVPGRTYGFFEARVSVTAGQTTVLPYSIWMPRLDTARAVRIPSPTTREVVVTTPFIPGLELHIPPNTVIRGHDGSAVREISITPIPVDRPPFPLPRGVDVPVYFTIQPGGAYVHTTGYGQRGARLVYPNYRQANPGVIASFWHYDPEGNGWYVYGTGKVTPDGKQVVPDPGVAIYEFTGAMMMSSPSPPAVGPVPDSPDDGDPVDLGTGLFVMEKTDLFLPDVMPIALTRTYRQNDPAARAFGIGSTFPYAIYLWSAQMYQEADLVLPDGGRIHYVRISPGTDISSAVFEHTTTPGAFYKSKVVWNGSGWDLTLKDGTVYVFGDVAPLQIIRDRYGNETRIKHSNGQWGDVTRVTSPNGRWVEFTYDASSRITQAKDNIGRTVGYTYDASGRLWKVTDPAGGITEYTYDSSHRMLTIKDARGIVYLENTYDANGRVTLQTQADDTTYDFDYTVDGSGKVTQTDVTNPRGFVTRHTFNSSGHHTSRIEAHGTSLARTTTWTRDSGTNRVTRITDGLGRHTDFTYDTLGNVASMTRLASTSDAVITSYTYDATFNLMTSVTDPLDHTTTFTRDTRGNVTTIADALGHETTLTYNWAGQPLTVTNAAGTTQFTYVGGDLISVTDPLGRVTTQFVDAAGRVRSTTNSLGQSVSHVYDALNAVTQTTDAIGGQTTFTYDANRNLLTLTDALNHTTTYTYDDLDRVATRTDPLEREELYAYDENGNVSETTDRKAQVTASTYDALDRLVTVTYDDSSTTTYTYDAGDRIVEIDDSIAGTIERTWDLLDRLTEEETPEGTVSYTYDAAGRRASMTVDGQPTVTYGYDIADRLTSITQNSAVVGFTYDNADRRTVLTLPNGVTVEYGYDAASQITALTYKLGTTTLGDLSYTYDLAGNRTSVGGTWARTGLPAAMASATYDAANQIATWASTSFTYDDNGNLTNDGTKTYAWNARNQLTGLSGSVSASFQYDGLGRRRAKTVSGTGTGFLYDRVNVVQELTGGSPSANILAGLSVDEWLVRTDSAGSRYFLADALGSTLALTNGFGGVATEYTSQPFGETTASGSSSSNAFQFTGRENDGTGLFFYRARYFEPKLQRFTVEDPLSFASGDVNLHAYVRNAPTIATDPSGLEVLIWSRPTIFRLPPNMRHVPPPARPIPRPSPPPPLRPSNAPWPPEPVWKPNEGAVGPLLKLLRKLMDVDDFMDTPLTPPPTAPIDGRKPPNCDEETPPGLPCLAQSTPPILGGVEFAVQA